jgi:hypothetical protein
LENSVFLLDEITSYSLVCYQIYRTYVPPISHMTNFAFTSLLKVRNILAGQGDD